MSFLQHKPLLQCRPHFLTQSYFQHRPIFIYIPCFIEHATGCRTHYFSFKISKEILCGTGHILKHRPFLQHMMLFAAQQTNLAQMPLVVVHKTFLEKAKFQNTVHCSQDRPGTVCSTGHCSQHKLLLYRRPIFTASDSSVALAIFCRAGIFSKHGPLFIAKATFSSAGYFSYARPLFIAQCRCYFFSQFPFQNWPLLQHRLLFVTCAISIRMSNFVAKATFCSTDHFCNSCHLQFSQEIRNILSPHSQLFYNLTRLLFSRFWIIFQYFLQCM